MPVAATLQKTNARPRAAAKSFPNRARYLSFEDFLRKDFGEKHVEWVQGKAQKLPSVFLDHAELCAFLRVSLGVFAEVHELGRVYGRPLLMRCDSTLPARCPDILFVKTENLTRVTREYLDGAADLVIEIVSEESRSRDRGAKFNEYEAGGVGEYWILDPARNRAEFY
ncbi:MAG: Uma2 family endonuclease, partial [Armatimonadetes bacterium]|nr:Uma2 family endonuclease [Armatimonadota bacterium]